MTVRESAAVTARPAAALIPRKFSFNEDMLKASSSSAISIKEDGADKMQKSATLGPASAVKLLRSSSFSNMAQKEEYGTLVCNMRIQ